MLKKVILICTFLIILSGSVNAQPSGFGMGVILGEPTGISAKYWMTPWTAFDGALGWTFGKTNWVQLHGDYLIHNYDIINVGKGKLPVYYGLGARLVFSSVNRVGIRGVVGLDYLFANDPLDIFLEIVPILDLAPDIEFDFNAGIGIRYYFN